MEVKGMTLTTSPDLLWSVNRSLFICLLGGGVFCATTGKALSHEVRR